MLLPCLFNERFPCSNIYLCVNLCRPKEQLVEVIQRSFQKTREKEFPKRAMLKARKLSLDDD